MSYGFKFFNNNNETVIDDTSTKPWYYGEAPVQFFFDITTTYTDLNKFDDDGIPFTTFPASDASGVTRWNVYSVTFSVPAAYDCFVCFGLPNTSRAVYYALEKSYSFAGDSSVRILIFVPNTLVANISDIPKAYTFVTNPVPSANLSTGYGMHVFNAATQCTYDSNKRHFQPTSLPFIYVANPTDFVYSESNTLPLNDNIGLNFPTNAAVLLPNVDVVYVNTFDYDTKSTHYKAIHRRVGNTLRTGVPRMYTRNASGDYIQSGFFNRGSVGLQPIVILDTTTLNQGYTPPEFPASYSLSINTSSLTEGYSETTELFPNNTATITLTTAGVANGTLVPYTISGISSSDINNQPLTGNFVVSGNSATITIVATVDILVEGTETASLALNNGKASIVFTISDNQSFALSVSRTNPEEGQSILVYLTTQNVPTGTLVPYNITGIQQADLTTGNLSGNFSVVASGVNGSASLQLSFARDSIGESETALLTLTGRNTSINIPITDLSYGYSEILSITPSTVRTNQTTTIQVTGGIPYDSFQWVVVARGINPVDSFNNRWSSGYQNTAASQTLYLDGNGNYYNQVTGSSLATVGNWTYWIFTATNKTFRSVDIVVSAAPTFSLTSSTGTKGPIIINEGQRGNFLVTTSNVPNGTVVYPILVNPATAVAADIANSAQNGLTINNNTGSFTIDFVADALTEGAEYFELVLDYPLGTRVDTYGRINIQDTSTTPASYSITRFPTGNVNEGEGVNFTFNTNQPNTYYWTLTGTNFNAADINFVAYLYNDTEFNNTNWAQQGAITSGEVPSTNGIQVIFKNDGITENAETVTLSIRVGSTSGTVVASSSVVVNDTSVYPAAGTASGNPYCIGFNKYQNYHNGGGGTYATLIESNSSFCGYITYNPTLTIVSDTWADYVVPTSSYTTITIANGAPNTTFLYAYTAESASAPTSYSSTNSGTLDANGNYTKYITGYEFIGTQGSVGDRRMWVKFAYDQSVRSARVLVVENAGTLSGGQYCSGTVLYQNKHNGRGGLYADVVQYNSPTCGYLQQYYPSTGSTNVWDYYNQDYVHDLWYIYDTKPNSEVMYKIVAGPAGVGETAFATSNSIGTSVLDVGNFGYTAGLYTINITFPGNDGSYPSNYRTLVAYWRVFNAYSTGGTGGY